MIFMIRYFKNEISNQGFSTGGSLNLIFFLNLFLVCPIWLPIFFFLFQLLNEPGLGEGIDPGMALTPFPSSIVLDEIRTHDLPIMSRVR